MQSPSPAGPLTSGPTPRDASPARVVDAPAVAVEVTAPAVGAAPIDPAAGAVVVGDVVLTALDELDDSASSWWG